MIFPEYRARRMRKNETLRGLIRETELSARTLIQPVFVMAGKNKKEEISSMPDVYRFSIDRLNEEADSCMEAGIKSIILFGLPDKKDHMGSQAHHQDGIIQKAIRELKKRSPGITIITDVCLCEYTDHGHCGCLAENGTVDNDTTLELLAKTALSHARAGADMIAPSDMMDGRISEIRSILDENDFHMIPIMSYAVKYASAFYGPFRDAADCAPASGDRRSYQMDPGNSREALREASMDMEEGADILMVKPALSYLDIIKSLRDEFDLPIAAYQVSGEYAMIKAASAKGWLEEEKVMKESLLSIRRAGADIIITYFAKKMGQLLKR